MKFISPFHAQQLIYDQALLLDVSAKAENYPLNKLLIDVKNNLFKNLQNRSILVTCQSGNRAQMAAKVLSKSGFEVIVIKGGNQAWSDAQLPIIRGEAVISLERQIRIVTGGLGLIGSLLAIFVAPIFALIPLIIGAGLLNAGITNWCGMGMILAKMPWNSRAETRCELGSRNNRADT